MVKVYCYFLRSSPNSLYAFTINKKYKELFEQQRNMTVFISGIKEFDDISYQPFNYMNRYKELTEDIVQDKETTISVICTIEESSKYSGVINEILSFIESLTRDVQMSKYPLQEEYLNIIEDLTSKIMGEGEIININTLKVFYNLFKETFVNTETDNE